MGYYDETEMTTRYGEKLKNRSRRGYFFSGFIGAMVGAATVAASVPYIVNSQLNQGQVSVVEQKVEGTAVPVAQMEEMDIAGMVQGAKDAVVGVINYQSSDFFSTEITEAGKGSGVIYKKSGDKALIITNNHVVEGSKRLEVKLNDGKKLPAALIGVDRLNDLAVLEVEAKDVTKVATLGNSNAVRVGERAIAIGNPLGLEGTVTEGIISSKDREIPVDIDQDGRADWQAQVLQTDASINPGNSGGALLNSNGEVIGINSSKIAQQEVEGIGFAIPIDVAKPIIESIEQYGEVKRPFVGVQLRSLEDLPSYAMEQLKLPEDVNSGVIVVQATPESPAAKAGLQEYDVIVALDGETVENAMQFRKYLYEKKQIGDTMSVSFYRNGQKQEKTVTLVNSSS